MNVEGIQLPPALQGRVCLKRPYLGRIGNREVWRETETSERHSVFGEANIALWANSIHTLSMVYMQAKATSSEETPGSIPNLRFVDTAIVLKSKPDSVKTTDWKGGFTALVERLLLSEDFVKYVSNGVPRPTEIISTSLYDTAQFLCFLQHVQYFLSAGKCFVSDYQGKFSSVLCRRTLINCVVLGAGPWLTDPQVMAMSK